MRIVIADDAVIGCDNLMALRVIRLRQFLKGHCARPLVFASPAGHRQQTLALGTYGHAPGHVIANVAIHIGINKVLRRRVPMAERGGKLLPIAGAVQAHHCLGSCRWIVAGPAQRHWLPVRLLAAEDRPMPRDDDLLDYRLLPALDANLLWDNLCIFPGALILILMWILRVEALQIDVLRIGSGIGDTPGDAPVAPDNHSRQPWQRGAGDIQARRVQVAVIPDCRHLRRQMWVVRQHRLAAGRARAIHHPVVAAMRRTEHAHQFFYLAILIEQRRIQTAIIGAWWHNQRVASRIERLNACRALRANLCHKLCPQQLRLPIAGQVPGHHLAPGQRIGGRPGRRRKAQQHHLQRQAPLVALDKGIDAQQIGIQQAARLLAYQRHILLRRPIQANTPQEAVRLQRHLAKQF